VLGHKTGLPIFQKISIWTRGLGALWIAALQMIVIPLVITNVIAVIGNAGAKKVGNLGGRALLLFVCMLIAAGLFAVGLTPPLVKLLRLDPQAMTSFAQSAASNRDTVIPGAVTNSAGSTDWLDILPNNLFEAAVKGNILSLLLFAVLFGLAITRLPAERRELLTKVFQGLSDAMLQLTKWILVVTPLGIFALTYGLALQIGISGGEMLVAYVVVASVLMILVTALLYPVTALMAGTSIGAFARGVGPAQLVAATTRSSIASLPALVEGARDRLNLPPSSTSFVLPLAVAVFKLNRPISTIVKLILVAHIFGITLGPSQIAVFLATVIILSFTTAGIPQNGPTFRTLPAYIAAGIPIEGVVILEAVEAIPDIFKTLLNVTSDMSAATILARSRRTQESHETAHEGAAAAEGVV